MSEIHPYNYKNPIPEGTRVLIVGTAPPERFSRLPDPGGDHSSDVRFYYGSRDNELWSKILPKITQFRLKHDDAETKRQEMISFLKLNRIWMHDIFEKYLRERAGSSLDSNLQLVEAADIKKALGEYSTIAHVIFTGGRAERETCRRMVRQGIAGVTAMVGKMPRSRTLDLHFEVGSRQIRLHVVPSPSAMTKRSGMKDAEKLTIYRQVLREACPDLITD